MKKTVIMAAIAAAFSFTSCGLGTTNQAISPTSQSDATGVLQQSGQGLLTNILSSLLGNITTEASLVGTWTYASPKVVFESENILSKLGGQVVSAKLEQNLGSQLDKMGFKAGKSKITLNSDKTCTFILGERSTPGNWTYDSESHKLTLSGALGLSQMTCTVSVVGNQMAMLFDADKLLTIANLLQTSNTSTLSNLLKNYSGLKLGWSMTK